MLIQAINDKLAQISNVTGIKLEILSNRLASLKKSNNLNDFFKRANIIYHAPGDATKTNLDKGTIDLVYSHAVLEHVPRKVVYDLTKEFTKKGERIECEYFSLLNKF